MQLKQIERSWRRLWVALLSRVLSAGHSRNEERTPRRRVLFLRPDRIGDMVVSTGVLRAIAEANGEIALDVLASPANAPVARGEPYIRRVHVLDRKRPWRWPAFVVRLRRERYDAVVDCMPTAASVTTLLLMLMVGARERIGVAARGIDDALTEAVPPRAGARHIVDHLSALATAFGIPTNTTDFSPMLNLSGDERTRALGIWQANAPGGMRRLLVNVSAGTAARYWPDERYIEVLRLVRQRYSDVQPLVIGGPEDAARVAAIGHAVGVPVARTATLREALALVGTADVMLSPDTGLGHAAVAFRTPAVVMHRRGSTVLWGLYGAPGVVLESDDETLMRLPVAAVWEAVQSLLRASTPAAVHEVGRVRRRDRLSVTPND